MTGFGREYKELRQLLANGTLVVGGTTVEVNGKNAADMQHGDWYVAQRNVGPKLLQCDSVSASGFVFPIALAYPYDLSECIPVDIIT